MFIKWYNEVITKWIQEVRNPFDGSSNNFNIFPIRPVLLDLFWEVLSVWHRDNASLLQIKFNISSSETNFSQNQVLGWNLTSYFEKRVHMNYNFVSWLIIYHTSKICYSLNFPPVHWYLAQSSHSMTNCILVQLMFHEVVRVSQDAIITMTWKGQVEESYYRYSYTYFMNKFDLESRKHWNLMQEGLHLPALIFAWKARDHFLVHYKNSLCCKNIANSLEIISSCHENRVHKSSDVRASHPSIITAPKKLI